MALQRAITDPKTGAAYPLAYCRIEEAAVGLQLVVITTVVPQTDMGQPPVMQKQRTVNNPSRMVVACYSSSNTKNLEPVTRITLDIPRNAVLQIYDDVIDQPAAQRDNVLLSRLYAWLKTQTTVVADFSTNTTDVPDE